MGILIVSFCVVFFYFCIHEIDRLFKQETGFFGFLKSCVFFGVHFGLSLVCVVAWERFLPFLIPLFFPLLMAAFSESYVWLNKRRKIPVSPRAESASRFFVFVFVPFTLLSALFMAKAAPVFVFAGVILFIYLFRRRALSLVPVLHLINVLVLFLLIFHGGILPSLPNGIKKLKSKPFVALRVRSGPGRYIFTDEKEENLYFTAHSKRRRFGTVYKTLYKLPLKKNGKIKALKYFFSQSGVVDAKRKKLFVICQDSGELLLMDPESLKILKKKKIQRVPTFIFMDTKRDKLIVLYEPGGMGSYDPDTLKEEQYVFVKRDIECCGVAKAMYSEKVDKFFVANLSTPFLLTAVRYEGFKTVQRKLLGLFSAAGIRLDNNETYIYMTDFLLGRVYKINAETFKVAKSAGVQSGLRPVEVDDKRGLVYVGSHLDPNLFILNKELKVIKKVFVGNPMRDIKLLKNGRLFVTTFLGLVEVDVDGCLRGHS